MPRQIDSRSGLTMSIYDSVSEIDFDSLSRLADSGWRYDYRGTTRILYDEAYLKWLIQGEDWFCIVVHDDGSRPVACIVALLRSLRVEERRLRAAYSTQWVVAPTQRKTGVGLWLANSYQRVAFADYRQDLIIGMLHEGHAAARTLGLFRRNKEFASIRVPQGAIWIRRLGATDADAQASCGWTAVRNLTADDVPWVSRLMASSANPVFSPSESFGRMYLGAGRGRSGTYVCLANSGACCAINFSLHALAFDEEPIGMVGQIQCVHTAGCDDLAVCEALGQMLLEFRQRKCVAACILDQGRVRRETLEGLGFVPSLDQLSLEICARADIAHSLSGLCRPFVFDFL